VTGRDAAVTRREPEHHEPAKFFCFPPLTWYKLNMATAGPPIILAAYICGPCDIRGRDREVSPGLVLCWNCGCPAVITARVAG